MGVTCSPHLDAGSESFAVVTEITVVRTPGSFQRGPLTLPPKVHSASPHLFSQHGHLHLTPCPLWVSSPPRLCPPLGFSSAGCWSPVWPLSMGLLPLCPAVSLHLGAVFCRI